MKYGVENLVTAIKNTKVRFYGTKFLELNKKNVNKFFFVNPES